MTLEDGQRQHDSEPLSRNELEERANSVLALFAQKSVKILGDMIREGQGRHVLGSVPERLEDEQLGIDAIGENILGRAVEKLGLPCLILGEHNQFRYVNASGETPHVILPTDPFDNSSEYKRGLDTPPYAVTGAYHSDGKPIGAVVADLRNEMVYVTVKGQTHRIDLRTGEKEPIKKSERTTLLDDNATLATYLGSNQYSVGFWEIFSGMIKAMPPKAKLYAGGGAFIYAPLAAGAVDAYVMFKEPRTEIDPGLPLALAAGCTIVSVNPDGTFEDYKFDPDLHGHGKIDLLVAACTPEVRDEIIRYYLQYLQSLKAA
ncbi:MAG: inositol monophosphatase family protein [bacterium]|nr:inositol monophosphatase family protein [bacterium]